MTFGRLVRAGGLAIAVNEALIRADQRPMVLALAGFMMADTQLSGTLGTLLVAFLDSPGDEHDKGV